MGAVISVTNQKGGVGKTLTASSLASILTDKGYKVLSIDMDPQSNFTAVAGGPGTIKLGDTTSLSILDVLKQECSIEEAIVKSDIGDLVRASPNLTQWTGRTLMSRRNFQELQEQGATPEEVYNLLEQRFREGWGVQPDRILSPIKMPEADVLLECLNLYQTDFKKPSLNIYCLDFSGSMSGEGEEQLKEAMSQILIQENAAENFLQANEGEVNIVIIFNSGVVDVFTAADDSDTALQTLYDQISACSPGGGTDIYAAAAEAYRLAAGYDLSEYTPAVILMTDGQSRNNHHTFQDAVQEYGSNIPVFSITFGDADPEQLEGLAELTDGRVFDGTEDLTAAFRSVKGYN